MQRPLKRSSPSQRLMIKDDDIVQDYLDSWRHGLLSQLPAFLNTGGTGSDWLLGSLAHFWSVFATQVHVDILNPWREKHIRQSRIINREQRVGLHSIFFFPCVKILGSRTEYRCIHGGALDGHRPDTSTPTRITRLWIPKL
ncbi:hypothetical protein PILCRDRAFT_238422 [Piloderma croceum F 1598]|uniref:Uncharacterized protein n=1 Tax=Piloderma croceum (strain F 1598) TaxID=765440 RepID=A0A0C3FX23_PILCF|nr:hypothetical protein PILCRDRAFT_238422 [Piloderma croceum F 1598]